VTSGWFGSEAEATEAWNLGVEDWSLYVGEDLTRYGCQLRDEGMERVTRSQTQYWRDMVDSIIQDLAFGGRPFTIDDVREVSDRMGLPDPKHPNAWGARIGGAARRGLISRTGDVRPSTHPDRHAHRNPVWVGGLHA
jgi:hypothetical protein